MNLMLFTKTALHNLFSKPATSSYPFKPMEYPDRTRGHIDIDIDNCIFCGLCSKKCPTGAITVNRADKSWSISRFSCIQCGYCVESCPKHCLAMKQTYTEPGASKTTDSFVQPPKEEPAPEAKPEVKAEAKAE